MDETKITLPAWLPWATTACLAALVACLVELWIIERTRNQLMRDEGLLVQSAMEAKDNQLAAERIIHSRELATLRSAGPAQAELRVALLEGLPGGPGSTSRGRGAAAWDPVGGGGRIRISGAPPQAPGRDLQLWLLGRGDEHSVSCGVFHAESGSLESVIHIDPSVASTHEPIFYLVDVTKGGARTLDEAQAGGPTVLATPSPDVKIPQR